MKNCAILQVLVFFFLSLSRLSLLQESYFKAMANAPIVVAEGDEDIELDYDSDGYPIVPDRAKVGPRLRPPR